MQSKGPGDYGTRGLRECGGGGISDFRRGFTLIELLVVIAVMGILAALIFPVTRAVSRNKVRSRTRTEMEQVATAIEIYKAKRGHYPPDNVNPLTKAANPSTNQLYYELVGTTNWPGPNQTTVYQTSDGRSQITSSAISSAFGTGVSGFVNSSSGGGGEEGSTVVNCLKSGLQASQVADLGTTGIKVLVGSVPLPPNLAGVYPGTAAGGYCAWRYVSSNPTNNPNSYDLWIDVVLDGKTNRICNWSRSAVIVGTP